jgi:hypothetical protein
MRQAVVEATKERESRIQLQQWLDIILETVGERDAARAERVGLEIKVKIKEIQPSAARKMKNRRRKNKDSKSEKATAHHQKESGRRRRKKRPPTSRLGSLETSTITQISLGLAHLSYQCSVYYLNYLFITRTLAQWCTKHHTW